MNYATTGRSCRRPLHRRLLTISLVGALTLLPETIAAAQAGENIERKQAFRLPSQPLSAALRQFAEQSGVQIAYATAIAEGARAPAVNGVMSADDALAQLLAGSGITSISDAHSVTLVKNQPQASAAGDTVTVVGHAEIADGPVTGYRAARSATATKTDTALRDLPQSVQVVPRTVLEDRQTTELTEALQNVSSVQQNGTSGNRAETFLVRGFSSPGYAIDGVMLNAAGDRPETFLDLANVERVEVLKGPVSALYGRGEPGGLINIVTRRPSYQWEGDASLQGGSFGFWRGEGSLSGPLTDDKRVTARLTGALQTEEGFVDERRRSDRQFLSTAVRWEPTDATRFNFGLDYTRQKQPFDRGLIVSADNQINLPRERFLGERWSQVEAAKRRFSFGAEHEMSDAWTLRGSLRYDDALVEDTGIDYRDLRDDDRTLRRRYTDRREDSTQFDAQLESQWTFATGQVDHTLLGGLQYTRSRMNFLSYRANIDAIDIYQPAYGAAMPTPSLNSDFRNTIRMASLFLQDQIDFSEQWKALAGLRYDRARQHMDQRVGDGDPDVNDWALTKRLGLVYRPVEPFSLYASYAESFVPQAGQSRNGQSLDPEEGWQVETGAKWDLLPDRLSLTTALFQINKRNIAADDPLDSDYSVLTGRQRVRGLEMDLTGTPLPGWELIWSGAYLDARITQDEDYAIGNRLTGVPKWSSSLWSTYRFQPGSSLDGLKLGAGVQMVGARKGDLDNSFGVSGYYRLDATVSYQLTRQLEVSVTGKNLTDQDYIETPVSRTENHPGAPRSVYVALKARFR